MAADEMPEEKTATVTRHDGTMITVQVTSENYLGFTGTTKGGELIVAYSDGREA